MSSSKQDAGLERSITNALSLINQSLRTLGPLASTSSTKPVPALPEGLRPILGTLLQTIRHTTTALALSFKPPVTVPAAVQQLDKIADEYARMVSCVIGSASHGSYSALVDEWREGVEGVGSELARLIEILRDSTNQAQASRSSKQGEEDKEYLAHTGMVWDAIDRIGDLSWTESEAVQKRLKGQRSIVEDAWTEFKEYLAKQDEVEDEDEEDGEEGDGLDDDDEWGELERGLGGTKMSADERSRAESTKTLLGLHQVLHASLPRFVPPTTPPHSDPSYRDALAASSEIVAAFDTAIASMYPEQDVKEIDVALHDLETKSCKAQSIFERIVAEISDQDVRQAQQDKLANFTERWSARLEAETKTWDERKLSVSSLGAALP